MGLWQMARNPTHYARLALLLILMAGLGILAASFTGTLERSSEDRVLYFSGSDLRLDNIRLNNRGRSRPLVQNYENIEGVEKASPAFRDQGQELSGGRFRPFEIFAFDRDSFADVAWFRDDFSKKPLADVMASLDYVGKPQGIELPDDARTIAALVKSDRPRPNVLVIARLKDSNNRYFTYRLGTLETGNWRLFEANLFERGNPGFVLFPQRPLTLVSLSIHNAAPQGSLEPGSILIDDIRARRATSEIEILESFRDIEGWNVIRERLQAAPDQIQFSDVSARRDGALMFSWSEGARATSRGIYPGPEAAPMPVLASPSFLRATGHGVGDEIDVSIRGREIPVRLADTIDFFPTLDTIGDRFLIADLDSLVNYANLGSITFELTPNEMWLSTSVTGTDRQALIEHLTSEESRALFGVGEIHDRAAMMADSRRDPLITAGWQALLFIAFAAILVLSGIGFLVHAYISFRNRQREFALMRTIGFSMRQLTALMFLEQALVIAVGMALGTWMGRRLGGVILPFLAHDDRGFQLVPPFVIEVTWGSLLVTYMAMGVVFAVIIASVILIIRRMALSRIMRLGEM
jgi:hypothetical protein